MVLLIARAFGRLCFVIGSHLHPFVGVQASDRDVEDAVEHAQDGQQQEEVVEVAPVEVVGDPSHLPILGGDFRDDGHQHGAQIAPQRNRGERQRAHQAAHGVRRLVVEKLQLADEGEYFGRADEEVLRHLPEDAHPVHGDRGVVWVPEQIVALGDLETLNLHDGRHHHGHDGYHEADAHALELREASDMAGPPAHEGHQQAVVDRDAHDDAEGVEDGERRRRDLEVLTHVDVHEPALLHEHGGHLNVDGAEHDPARPDRQQPDDDLHFLHLRHGC